MTEAKPIDDAATARRLMRSVDFGVLSTISSELPGYPFGSVTPYVLTHGGRPVIYVSHIAQHTSNMKADRHACLTVAERAAGNQQALGRVTLVGDAEEVPAEAQSEVQARYFRFHPEARQYGGAHAFAFYWLDPVRVRYIGGFGKIYWIEPGDWLRPEPTWAGEEDEIIAHMNADHVPAMLHMAREQAGLKGSEAQMLACDSEGCHLRVDGEIGYIGFSGACQSVDDVRRELIQLARSSG